MTIGESQSDIYYDAPDGWTAEQEDHIEEAARTLVDLTVADALDNIGKRWEDVPDLTEEQFTEAREQAEMAMQSLVSCPDCHRVGGHKMDCGRRA
ncbi:hypothetical protein [Cryobacterium sp. PH31-O1]|uniref:hypothetical protein n=1 Tax=Cryobacterium sp. PH31-O1 TaxID=3046306 RepID=UPI0024B9CA15|nr:hypothetical protein [Cryobacterium sp. PH31-O1]MDJ0337426.1 hypothetical protein [Cryobacterium sp. PH31-O1]